ncbi:hypothetical protein Q3G72_034909 [Acer saccharum]|nr:hypothetical protein Q3G72_034909 [Acer saccharum]
MKTIHDHDFLTLGFGSKGIGICVVDVSEARSFVVPVLESCDENFTLLPLEITMKETMIKEIMLKVMSLKRNLLKNLYSLLKDFARNEMILKTTVLKRDSSVPPGEYKHGRFVLHRLLPLQVLKPERCLLMDS